MQAVICLRSTVPLMLQTKQPHCLQMSTIFLAHNFGDNCVYTTGVCSRL